jgi:hypothetical protein
LFLPFCLVSFFTQSRLKWEYLDEKDSVITKEYTGAIEDKDGVWIHPPRSGKPFIYTESAPFPQIKYPIDSIQTWKGGLAGLKGYESIGLSGEVSNEYVFSAKQDIQTDYKLFQNCWVIESIGESCIGISTHRYYFDENYGFVYLSYHFPTGEKLILSLLEYKEGKN